MRIETSNQTISNLVELKEQYKQRLDQILYKQLSPDNIETFADEALNDLVVLTSDVLEQYKSNAEFEGNLELAEQQQEDDAFTKLDLPNIQEILQRVIEVRDKISELKSYIERSKDYTDTVITPPQIDYHREIVGGSGQGIEDKKLVPRLLTLLYLLETDLSVAKDTVRITEGAVDPNSVRSQPYVRVEIDELQRVVYLCDEEGNVSYVFDIEKLKQAGLSIEDIDVDDKRDKNSLIAMYPGIGARVVYTKYWRNNIANFLSDSIPEKSVTVSNTIEEYERQKNKEPRSEFVRPKFLSFEDLQDEVKTKYHGENDVKAWYNLEKKNHKYWPSAPYVQYKDKGWQGWPELVGKENRFKRDFLDFEVFQKEVRDLYQGESDISAWYHTERKMHKDWPSTPYAQYKDKGWLGFPELVNVGNRFKKQLVDFPDFQKEVAALYKGGEIKAWYREESRKHEDWPSAPDVRYKADGWSGWPELVGKENPFKKDFLDFTSFQREIKNFYPGKRNIKDWYNSERKNHGDWPSAPHLQYKDKGWAGWIALVGKENK